jgi:hypothetical protein
LAPPHDVDGVGDDEVELVAGVVGTVLLVVVVVEDAEVELADEDGLGLEEPSPGTPFPALIICFVGRGSLGLPARYSSMNAFQVRPGRSRPYSGLPSAFTIGLV